MPSKRAHLTYIPKSGIALCGRQYDPDSVRLPHFSTPFFSAADASAKYPIRLTLDPQRMTCAACLTAYRKDHPQHV